MEDFLKYFLCIFFVQILMACRQNNKSCFLLLGSKKKNKEHEIFAIFLSFWKIEKVSPRCFVGKMLLFCMFLMRGDVRCWLNTWPNRNIMLVSNIMQLLIQLFSRLGKFAMVSFCFLLCLWFYNVHFLQSYFCFLKFVADLLFVVVRNVVFLPLISIWLGQNVFA